MKPIVDNTGQSAIASGTNTITIPAFIIGTGLNKLVYYVASRWSAIDRTVSSVVLGSQNFSRLDEHSQAIFGGTQHVDIWSLKNPTTSTTGNIVAIFSGNVDELIAGAVSLFNVDQATPFGAVGKNASTSIPSDSSVTLISNDNQLCFDAVVCGDDAGTGDTATGTEHWNRNNALNASRGCCQSKDGAASVTLDWTGGHMGGFVAMAVGINGAIPPLERLIMLQANQRSRYF